MLVYEKTSWFKLIFTLRGTTLRQTKWRLLISTAWACLATWLELEEHWRIDLTVAPFTLVGLALSIFLGFRNSASYDRFWEGRRLWGQIVNSTRNVTRLVLATVGPLEVTDEVRERHRDLVYHVIAWTHAVRMHLRDEKELEPFRALLPATEVDSLATESNRPNAILQHLSTMLRQDVARGWLDPIHHLAIEQEISQLVNSQGGCERIKSTPIPFSYTVLLHQVVAGYCFALPFGLVRTVGALTPLVVAMIAYAFFSLDAVGDEIEQPFGRDANDLPLEAISRNIEIALRERLLEEERPSVLKPVKHQLS
ncbi:MAG: bestrophin family protein [Polyangiales bacterium]